MRSAHTTPNHRSDGLFTPGRWHWRWAGKLSNCAKIWMLIALCLPAIATSGCSGNKPRPDVIIKPGIGFVDGEYRVCNERCPHVTPKLLDVAGHVAAVLPVPAPAPIPASARTEQIPEPVPRTESVTRANVLFGFGKATPARDGYRTLAELIETAKSANSAIELAGRTDSTGTKKYNDRLAFQRAHYVARWLRRHGAQGRISVESEGLCCYLSPDDETETARAINRRVEVTVQPIAMEK